ncbi:Spindle pole body-associated protein [Heracleum sosnowskyi]|uniref:Spindle pole body-associated protein n=1 Tax=Heracleum sosnowskyi TaxID=360622 RepID=A0AAD8HVD4_9APIA|nr:Spindle pole body-associated protein [Heracleum sosnowskyi]
MIAQFLSPLPITITCSLQPHDQICKTHLLNSTKRISFTFKNWNLINNNNMSGVKGLRCSSKDDNGTVDDMESYLNNLSLEYDSVWDTKPAWCQPWTITLTGVLAITCSWLVLHSVVITGLVLSLISAWWYIFLYSYPKGYSDMISERRKKVTNGVEDTFGLRKSQ